ncbi:MAG TPA: hypothetical protein VNA69_20245 [Thermoanaerobaculia bacterium]|nr:hypothetical protein [Thermoanaerobaculia bacterium]
MKHLTQEELIICYYNEPERAQHVAHLADCEKCQTELGRLAQLLDRVPALEVPEPEADYEHRVWQRLGWRLRGEKKRERAWTRWAAIAAMAMIAFVSGLLLRREAKRPMNEQTQVASGQAGIQATADARQERVRDRILFVFVGNHFDQSERILVELTNLQVTDDTDISKERERAGALLASNRLYRRTAQDRGEDNVAALLEELEPVLLQIARAPSDVSAAELRKMQERVKAKGLVLKLRVVRADVRANAAATKQPNV